MCPYLVAIITQAIEDIVTSPGSFDIVRTRVSFGAGLEQFPQL